MAGISWLEHVYIAGVVLSPVTGRQDIVSGINEFADCIWTALRVESPRSPTATAAATAVRRAAGNMIQRSERMIISGCRSRCGNNLSEHPSGDSHHAIDRKRACAGISYSQPD